MTTGSLKDGLSVGAFNLCHLMLKLCRSTQSTPNNLVGHTQNPHSPKVIQIRKKEEKYVLVSFKNKQQCSSSFVPKIQRIAMQFLQRGILDSQVGFFHPLGPQDSINSLILHILFRSRVSKILEAFCDLVVVVSLNLNHVSWRVFLIPCIKTQNHSLCKVSQFMNYVCQVS